MSVIVTAVMISFLQFNGPDHICSSGSGDVVVVGEAIRKITSSSGSSSSSSSGDGDGSNGMVIDLTDDNSNPNPTTATSSSSCTTTDYTSHIPTTTSSVDTDLLYLETAASFLSTFSDVAGKGGVI